MTDVYFRVKISVSFALQGNLYEDTSDFMSDDAMWCDVLRSSYIFLSFKMAEVNWVCCRSFAAVS